MTGTNMQVFEFARSWADDMVTICASNLAQAETIYSEWIETHHPDRPPQSEMVFPYAVWSLHGRPELAAACNLGQSGVGYWDPVGARWLIADPRAPAHTRIARPQSFVKYHRVAATDGDELMVFAKSYEEAVGMYVSWHSDAYGGPPDGLTVLRRSRWQLVLALASLRDEMDAGLVGVASWSSHDGWHIHEPDHGTVIPEHLR